MLKLTIPKTELWDGIRNKFITVEEQTLELEHSLVSLSTWESKWCKAFLSKHKKSSEETLDYIKCMTLNPDIPPEVYYCLTDKHLEQIIEYIEAPMTAVYFPEEKSGKVSREVVTSELIEYWMLMLNIPFEYREMHLNRLFSLIRVANMKNNPKKNKRQSQADLARQYADLNAQRLKQLNTRG